MRGIAVMIQCCRELKSGHVLPTMSAMLKDMHKNLITQSKFKSPFWNTIAQGVDIYVAVALSALEGHFCGDKS
eukprot:TRINITY_DN13090_c0_g1_i1.p1 TRINITY_DN13090_c0_g1~~TRINITY_DN13090_c0_g1_i1.p1  ORF type:complete len:73 (+),score=14.46 TRINITY_DN13090_c0_g1_i1:120-338(+)